jgi:hypothetical protein
LDYGKEGEKEEEEGINQYHAYGFVTDSNFVE